jgi:hypothetical protein
MSDRPTAQQSDAVTQVTAESIVGAKPALGELTIDQLAAAEGAAAIFAGDVAANAANVRTTLVETSAAMTIERHADKRQL